MNLPRRRERGEWSWVEGLVLGAIFVTLCAVADHLGEILVALNRIAE